VSSGVKCRPAEPYFNGDGTGGQFALAYHYLTQGNIDAVMAQLKEVVTLAPQDTLSAQLIKQFSPPATASDTQAAATAPPRWTTPPQQGNLAGNWTAHAAGDTKTDLHIGDDETFSWNVTTKGKPGSSPEKWSLTNNLLTLAQAGYAGTLVGRVSWQADDKRTFRVIGKGPEDRFDGMRQVPPRLTTLS
jgi:hypothetical protein